MASGPSRTEFMCAEFCCGAGFCFPLRVFTSDFSPKGFGQHPFEFVVSYVPPDQRISFVCVVLFNV